MKKTFLRSTHIARIIAVVCFGIFFCSMISAQRIASQHKVKKQETIFGITKLYGVTIDELREANPIMREPDFQLKKGMLINIPEVKRAAAPAPAPAPKTTPAKATVSKPTYTIGVMLPLHDINGDGRRMVEYYRGMLLAVNALKQEGFNITVNAWNVAEGDDISKTLKDVRASQCNVIFGPLYTTQVPALSAFCQKQGIALVIPFSISGNDVATCPAVHQVYQTPADITAASINEFLTVFADYHPIFIDCNDATSNKGTFTFGLRSRLDARKIPYSITNLDNSSDEMFLRSFSTERRNIVILNSGRSPELGRALKRLDYVRQTNPSVQISMFGYNEWFMYDRVYGAKFHQYDAYVPSVYDYNANSVAFQRIETQYKSYFKVPVQQAVPCFAITGYDHTMFFVRGIDRYGKNFHGTNAQQIYNPIQTPLRFERLGNGGYQNRTFMLVHYK